jgi:NAD(P)H-hydrate epimerase
MIVVTTAEMRALDRWTIEHHTPGPVLMERAGTGAAETLRRQWCRTGGPVVVCCGKGNNGGDGLVLARQLRRARVGVEVWLAGRRPRCGRAAEMLGARRGAIYTVSRRARSTAGRRLGGRVVVDALLGTGLNTRWEGVLRP